MDIERPNSWFEPNEEPRTKEYEVVLSISKVVEAVDQEEALEIAKSDVYSDWNIDNQEIYRQ